MEQGGVLRLGIGIKQGFEGRDRTAGDARRGCRDGDRDTLPEGVGFGSREGDGCMRGIGSVGEKLDGTSSEVGGLVATAGPSVGGEFPTAEECRISEAAGRADVKVLGGGKVKEEIAEDGKGDRLFWLAAGFSVVAFDAPDEVLDNWGFCGRKGEICVNMERLEMGKVQFDCFGLDSSAKPGNPCYNGILAGWQEGAIWVCKSTDRGEGDERFLPDTVGSVSAGRNAMLKVKSDLEAKVPKALVPPK